MGYIKHDCVIITGEDYDFNGNKMTQARAFAYETYKKYSLEDLVSELHGGTNCTYTFMLAPDGSKEGWDTSDNADKAREEVLAYIRKEGFDFIHFQYGGDFQHDFEDLEVGRMGPCVRDWSL